MSRENPTDHAELIAAASREADILEADAIVKDAWGKPLEAANYRQAAAMIRRLAAALAGGDGR